MPQDSRVPCKKTISAMRCATVSRWIVSEIEKEKKRKSESFPWWDRGEWGWDDARRVVKEWTCLPPGWKNVEHRTSPPPPTIIIALEHTTTLQPIQNLNWTARFFAVATSFFFLLFVMLEVALTHLRFSHASRDLTRKKDVFESVKKLTIKCWRDIARTWRCIIKLQMCWH